MSRTQERKKLIKMFKSQCFTPKEAYDMAQKILLKKRLK